MLYVLLSGVSDLYRSAGHVYCGGHGPLDEVHLCSSAETTAQQGAVDSDLAALQPGPGTIEEREDEAYPVPTLGLGGAYRFAPKWSLRSGVQYFEYSADDWDASLIILDVDVEYFPWKNVGFGLGYNLLEIGYDEDGGDALDIDFEYDGILLRALFEF